ncbi:MAG: DUF4389 domain-containing protein [Candidatus Thiodubiliella endoseptemdiera]|uniref:DUF4389 domain-containing protein n=1 Tax=Candidatus Thiodubiliella endoseptemdiera TaxID=2738886 RepID=A0A853F0Q2_9GAMM|nr:DUF4389 domain-containing protein [Candidatus Thiodubiliella endoseptemdiera]
MSDNTNYPAQLNIKYNDSSNRVTVFFRLLLVIPAALIIALLSGFLVEGNNSNALQVGGGFLFLPIMLMIVVRGKYPKWWFDWVCELSKLSYRILAYSMLLTDKYPSVDEEQDIGLVLKYPDVKKELNRYLPLIKWLLAAPHFLILIVIYAAIFVLSPVIWLTVLIMGKMPETLFNFLVGFLRYNFRVSAYAILLITDKYPPFNGKP